MRTFQITLLSGAPTPVVQKSNSPAANYPFQWVTFQNNSAAAIRVGDANVTASRGMSVGSTGGALTIALGINYSTDLTEYYIFGTSGAVIDVMVIE